MFAALCVATLWLSANANPARAIVATVGGHGYGVAPIRGVNPAGIGGAYGSIASIGLTASASVLGQDELPNGGGPLIDDGGPVMHSNTTHVIYWDPNGEFTVSAKGVINSFFTDVAHDSGLASNIFGVDAQYGASYSSTYGGEAADTDAYPSTGTCTIPGGDGGPPYTKCLYDSQLQSELSAYIGSHDLPTGPTQLYFLLLPHKVVTCFAAGECSNNVYCAYHSYIKPGESDEIIYAAIPFSLLDTGNAKGCQYDGHSGIQTPNGDTAGTNEATRFADVAVKYISHEYSEAITDPLVGYETAWVDEEGLEIGDKCNAYSSTSASGYDAHAFLPTLGGSAASDNLFDQAINEDHYYLQSEWDNATSACLMRPALSATFTPSSKSVPVGTQVSFSTTTADPYGSLTLGWNFGDGATGAGSSPTHAYAAPGEYIVTMTATDPITGSMTPVSHTVVVNDVPTASFTSSPNPATVGAPVEFNGAASTDPDGSIASYAWEFGDGAAGSGVTPNHTYGAPGTYTVNLRVTDIAGETNATSHQITVTASTGESSGGESSGGESVAGGSVASGSTTGQASSVVTSPSAALALAAFGHVSVNSKTGAVTFRLSVGDPGAFSWILTVKTGKLDSSSARNRQCKVTQIKPKGACAASEIVFGRGSEVVADPGALSLTVRPSAPAMAILENALRQKKGLTVTAALSFRASRGGSTVSHTQSLRVKLTKESRGHARA